MKNGFFKNVKSELKKVVWPTKKQLMNNTFMVLFLVLAVSAIVLLFELVVQTVDAQLWNYIASII